MKDFEHHLHQELEMASSDLLAAAKAAAGIKDAINTAGDIEPWQSSKISTAADYLTTVFQSLDSDTLSQDNFDPEQIGLMEKEVWDKPKKSKKKPKKLSSAKKSAAKARAKRAGRPYPNLIDNMWASTKESVDRQGVTEGSMGGLNRSRPAQDVSYERVLDPHPADEILDELDHSWQSVKEAARGDASIRFIPHQGQLYAIAGPSGMPLSFKDSTDQSVITGPRDILPFLLKLAETYQNLHMSIDGNDVYKYSDQLWPFVSLWQEGAFKNLVSLKNADLRIIGEVPDIEAVAKKRVRKSKSPAAPASTSEPEDMSVTTVREPGTYETFRNSKGLVFFKVDSLTYQFAKKFQAHPLHSKLRMTRLPDGKHYTYFKVSSQKDWDDLLARLNSFEEIDKKQKFLAAVRKEFPDMMVDESNIISKFYPINPFKADDWKLTENEIPMAGDIIEFEVGDTVIETVIESVDDEGVLIAIDDTAAKLLSENSIFGSLFGHFDKKAGSDGLKSVGYLAGVAFTMGGREELWPNVKLLIGDQRNLLWLRIKKTLGETPGWPNDPNFKEGFYEGYSDAKNNNPMLSSMIENKLDRIENSLDYLGEAKYQGREVSLGKPFLTPGGPKKRAVYVKNDKGNVVKVNFGDPKMKIKKSNPKRRKSFRARHNCSNPGPRWKARFWSCKAW